MMRALAAVGTTQAQRQALVRINLSLSLIATGLLYRDQQIRNAILSELALTTVPSQLIRKPVELLNTIAETITMFSRRLSDGFAYETLLEIQTEARAIFGRLERAR
jgi:hypothetical protein